MKKIILLTCLILLLGCGSSTSPSQGVKPTEKPMDKDQSIVSNITENIIGPKISTFKDQIINLKKEVNKACGNQASLVDLRSQWRKAMLTFHYLESITSGSFTERDDLLARNLYSWSKSSVRAPLYKQMRRARNNPNYKLKKSTKYKSLYALELILFDKYRDSQLIQSEDLACPYISLLAEDLELSAIELSDRWQTEQIEYFKDPKNKLNYTEFLGEMVTSMQYLYKNLQQKKLAPLLGEPHHEEIPECKKNTTEHRCIEHHYSSLTQEAVVQNIQALQDVFTGKGGFGFISYLEDLNKRDQANSISKLLTESLQHWRSVRQGNQFIDDVKAYRDNSCEQDQLCLAYQKLSTLVTWIKSDFVLLMNTELPEPVQGDND